MSTAAPYPPGELPRGFHSPDCWIRQFECWKTKEIWDDVLRDQRIVVTTHAILSDALFHGFVPMPRLALLIYDEGSNISFMLRQDTKPFSKRTIAFTNIRQTRL